MQKKKNFWLLYLVATFSFTSFTFGETSPLCNELARFACAPGSYKDGTGESKNESDVNKLLSSYAEKSRLLLNDRFQKILESPENSYFKDLAMAGLGLKNSPQCTSKDPENVLACKDSLLSGLTTIAQKQALGSLLPKNKLARGGNLKELSFITENNNYQKVIRELNEQVQKDLNSPVLIKKIQDKIFPNVKILIIERLKKLSIPDEQKNLMVGKINSISFEGATCEEMTGGYGRSNGEVVSALLTPNAFYDPIRNIFKLCSGLLLQSNSEFMIVAVIAHELSHSIDPCNIARGPIDMGFKYSNFQDIRKMESEYPIKNVLSCLRDRQSVGARNFSGDSDAFSNENDAETADSYSSKKKNKGTYSKKAASFCENDQIGESLADWMAFEILPKYMESNYKLTTDQYRNGYANSFRPICNISSDDFGEMNSDVHPAMEKRINNIILVNPQARTQMGCPSKHPENIYCDSEKPLNNLKAGFGCTSCLPADSTQPRDTNSSKNKSGEGAR